MTDQPSDIDRYRARWKPNEALIAELKADLKNAIEAGAIIAALAIESRLWSEMLPPIHIPIRRLEITDDSS